MAASKHLVAMLRSHIDGDNERFLSVAMQAAAHEARQGHGSVARQLRDLVDEAQSPKPKRISKTVSISQPKGELSNLLSASSSDMRLSHMVLSREISNRLVRIIDEQLKSHILAEHGLRPRRKILLVGPPGSGKTMTASVLAGELKQPLFSVIFESLITKFLGDTAAKLRVIFDAMTETKGVYLFDEFDAIGSRRGERNDVGEIRRILNSFLKLMERENSSSLIIAATNHPDLLDPALFRRFDDVIEYSLPNHEIAERILKIQTSRFARNDINWEEILTASKGLSHAEISRVAEDAIKHVILNNIDEITSQTIMSAIGERKNLISG